MKIAEFNAETKEIYEYLTNSRGVKYLVHFTPVENLRTILQYGILPRRELAESNIPAVMPDGDRFDSKHDCSSFSVSFPNYRMLSKKRFSSSEGGNYYAVILIDVDVIGLFSSDDLFFFSTNAAVKDYRFEENRFMVKGVYALKEMFLGRRFPNLPAEYPSDPQAEIMIRGAIPPEYIDSIFFCPNDDIDPFSYVPPAAKSKIKISKEYFDPREDYQFWQKR